MRGRLILLALALSIPLTFYVSEGSGAPDPVNCTGYPEPRIYLENQSWWTPQPVDPSNPSHPGTGGVGHIHIGTCYPLYQTLTGPSLHLDVTVKLHNMPGKPAWLTAQSYGDVQWQKRIPLVDNDPAKYIPRCASGDCQYDLPFDIDLTQINYNGWHNLALFLNVTNADGTVQRPWAGWFVNFQVPGKPQGIPGADAEFGTGAAMYSVWTAGDTWYSNVANGAKYARASINRTSIPWDETTGALTPLSGTWPPTVNFEKVENFVYIDPAFHAVPPSKGFIVYEGNAVTSEDHRKTLSIDTTQLTNGLHRLVIGTGNVVTNGTHTGVLVVPFLVHNLICHY